MSQNDTMRIDQVGTVEGHQLHTLYPYEYVLTMTRALSNDSEMPHNATPGADILVGTDADEVLDGGLGDDRIYGNGGDDTLIGSLGRDILDGGSGTNTFVYSHLTQSYHAGNEEDRADLIRNFETGNNLIDVSKMGFYGFGNGHADTLVVTINDAGTRTYLKSYSYDEGGDRFELAFEGDVRQYLTESNIIFTSTHVVGTSSADFLDGTEASEVIEGKGGDDHLFGNGGNDTLTGGLGRDTLDGGSGANTFIYQNVTDSYRDALENHADVIRNFAESDSNRVDVSALGFTRLGDGHNGTLAVSVNDAGTRTYLKSYDASEDGHRFEVAFDGAIAQYLSEDRIVFANTHPNNETIAQEAVSLASSEPVTVEQLGVIPHHDATMA